MLWYGFKIFILVDDEQLTFGNSREYKGPNFSIFHFLFKDKMDDLDWKETGRYAVATGKRQQPRENTVCSNTLLGYQILHYVKQGFPKECP